MSPKSSHEPLTLEIHAQQRILFVGRVVPDKGLDWLLRSMVEILPHIHLDIAGEGWDLDKMKILAKTLKLTERITWHGWCNGEKLEDLYRQSLAVVFPSLWPEPAGLVTLEAYARFRPIITSKVGGIPEHVRDRKTGILVKPNDTKELATAINLLAKDFDKAKAMGISGNDLFQKEFTLTVHARKLREIYDEVISKFSLSRKYQ
jgi:glycosyltransferase involved in cell wall biosynthesis